MVLKTAVIIAGGKGTRLEEHTKNLPKPLIPVGGIPLLERTINWLKKNNVKNIIIGVAYKKEKIKEYFGDGSKLGVKITYTEHDENSGTEDAFKTAILDSGIEDENFYALNCDQITDLDIEKLANFHLKKGGIATLTTIRLRSNFGIIKKDENDNITKFQEKGEIPGIIMNAGIYVFNKKIKEYLQSGNIEKNTFVKLIPKKKIFSYFHNGTWLTVNNKKELEIAEKFLSN